MKRPILLGLAGLTAAVVLVGCTRTDPTPNNAADPKAADEAKAKYLLASEPAGAKGVIELRKTAKDGDAVIVIGRIGGSKEPFTGRAAFEIVDTSFVACTEKPEPEESETPWEFC